MTDLLSTIRSIPDFPKKGIIFRDITTLWDNAEALQEATTLLVKPFEHESVDKVIGVESRGFVLGSTLALQLHAGFIPIRKKGKLPAAVLREEYTLEYGTDIIEIHQDAIKKGERVLLHDDLLATGGTMQAAARLVERAGGIIVGISFLAELPALHGREKLQKYPVHSLLQFDGL